MSSEPPERLPVSPSDVLRGPVLPRGLARDRRDPAVLAAFRGLLGDDQPEHVRLLARLVAALGAETKEWRTTHGGRGRRIVARFNSADDLLLAALLADRLGWRIRDAEPLHLDAHHDA